MQQRPHTAVVSVRRPPAMDAPRVMHAAAAAVVCLLAASAAVMPASAADVILPPPPHTTGAAVGLLFFEGAQIKPQAYVPYAMALQAAVPFPLWVGIPEFSLDVPEPMNIDAGTRRVLANMTSQGWDGKTLFFAGHSLGGAMGVDYVHDHWANATGFMLYGSFITRKHRSSMFPVKTLQVGGELDGLCKIGRMAEEVWHRQVNPLQGADPVTDFPVVILKGQNHMQFASGPPPMLVAAADLKPEVSDEEARAATVAISAAFMRMRLGDASQQAAIKAGIGATRTFAQPLMDSMEMEGSYHFLPSCDGKPKTPACADGSGTWAETVMAIMADLPSGAAVSAHNTFHDMHASPTMKPAILNNCTSLEGGCVVNVTTVSQNIYSALDGLDTGFTVSGATEVRVKMMSRAAVQAAAGAPGGSDTGNLCEALNKQALQWAQTNAAPATMARFAAHGEPLVVGADISYGSSVFFWIGASLKYSNTTDAAGQAVSNATAPAVIDTGLGHHYCKVLSPAYVMEWLYGTGLHLHYGLPH